MLRFRFIEKNEKAAVSGYVLAFLHISRFKVIQIHILVSMGPSKYQPAVK